MDLFGLGSNAASVWIRDFREAHPDWVSWNSVTRSYHATPAAYRKFLGRGARRDESATSLAQYLALVGLPNAQPGGAIDSGLMTAFSDLATPHPQVFSTVSEAIRLGRKVEVTYRSMQHPEPHGRVITPHSLIRAGRRWHARAYCDFHQGFRDYALGRIETSKLLTAAADQRAESDQAWQAEVRVRLIAHPKLSAAQEDVIRFEYFNGTSARVETCRGALVAYLIQDVRAATDIDKQCPPDFQLAVENIDEVRPWLFPS
jgi:predicted DNA-binding transcriptional regulator YafY